MFSLFFQYHFTFLAVSVAVLGLCAGAATAHYLPAPLRRSARASVIVLMCLSVTFSVAILVIAWLPSAESILSRALAALIIFFLIGLFDAITFTRFTADSSAFYAADLIGAALGVVIVLWLLSVWSAFSMTLFLAALIGGLAVAMAYRTAHKWRRSIMFRAAAGSLALGLILLIVNLLINVINFNPSQLTGATRDKTMISILQDPAQNGRILYTAWSPFARVDVVQTNDQTARYLFADGGAGVFMLHYNGDPATLQPLQNTIEYVPYSALTPNRTLVIGAGSGKDILLAKAAQAQAITAVEVNPAVVAATRYFGDYNGHVLDLPGVTLVEGDARSFAERTTDQFDMIYLNLVYTQAVEPASQALVENYIFRRQAFRTFLNQLAPGGRLAIVSHNALEGSRAAVTALQAMQDSGIAPAQALDHLWLWMYPASDKTISTSVLIVTHIVAPLLALAKTRAKSVYCLRSGVMRAELRENYGNPYPIETAIFDLDSPTPLVAQINRTMFHTARTYQETFNVYGEKASFEWEQIEGEDPIVYRWIARAERGSDRHGSEISAERLTVPDYGARVPPEIARFTRYGFYDERHPETSFQMGGGHDGSHPHMAHEFIRSIIEHRQPTLDAINTANWNAPGICAHESAMQGGARVDIPQFDV